MPQRSRTAYTHVQYIFQLKYISHRTRFNVSNFFLSSLNQKLHSFILSAVQLVGVNEIYSTYVSFDVKAHFIL